MNIIHKIGFSIILIIAAIYGSAYLFNHVNPWLGIAVPAIVFVLILGTFANPILKRYKKEKNDEKTTHL